MALLPRLLRRLLRPLAPWRRRERTLRRRLLRQVGHNVDVVVAGPLQVWRWLATAPLTYRAGIQVPADAAATFRGHARPPAWRRRRQRPHVEPVAMTAARVPVLGDIGATGAEPVAELFDRMLQAGHRVAVAVEGRPPQGALRLDPIPRPTAVVLSGVPLADVGGGSRGAQLGVELLNRGYHVAFVARAAMWESGDVGLRHIHPHLEQYAAPHFDPEVFSMRASHADRLVICEIPSLEYRAAATTLQSNGFRFVYDLIDDWSDPDLGLEMYVAEVEAEMIASADGLVGSAVPLVERLGPDAVLVPNGVNESLFGGDPGPRPGDLPDADAILGYHGSLYGSWLNWSAVTEVAEANPEAAVVMIGDPADVPALPRNVHLLGVKAQFQLPPYVGRYDVGLVPFHTTDMTHAVSPLKAFECLAMGVPVAAPPLQSLEGVEGVYRHESLPDAVTAALQAPKPDGAAARLRHGWSGRLADLLATVKLELPPVTPPALRRVLRPADRHARRRLA